ncbi:hypothetical protein BHE74_00040887 [Ensete ventricosum]|nr:hypothetical protein BHE74_00040887 [Ensete ventricosum]RZS16250.1 hypothetical protein BHM03_00048215 [Ensete ventricosum]
MAVTPEAFQGLTNQVQPIAGMLQAIIPYIPQLANRRTHCPWRLPRPRQGQHRRQKVNLCQRNLLKNPLGSKRNLTTLPRRCGEAIDIHTQCLGP